MSIEGNFYANGADMWRDILNEHGIIAARVVAHHYLNVNADKPEMQQSCAELREVMVAAENSVHIPIYLHSERFAELDGKTDIYTASMKAFAECGKHVDLAVQSATITPHEFHFDLAVAALVDQHSFDRVEIVLKSAALHDLPFRRFSENIYAWAKDFKKPDHFGNFDIRTPPAVLAGLIEELRKQEAVIKMENQTQPPELQEVKPLIRFIDSDYRELFNIPDGEKIRITYPPGDGRGTTECVCKRIGEMHTKIGRDTYHICEFAEKMERIGAKYEPVNQLKNMEILPPAEGENKFCEYNREEGNTCAGSLHGNFSNDGERFTANWNKRDNGLFNGEMQSEFQAVVFALRQDLLKDRASMIAYCKNNPDAKLSGGTASNGNEYGIYGFKLETESRQYFVKCYAEGRDSNFSIFAYADKPTLVLAQNQPQSNIDKEIMRNCIDGLGVYAAMLSADRERKNDAAEIRDLISDIVPYWGLNDGEDSKALEDFLQEFDSKVDAAIIDGGIDADSYKTCADILTGLARYGEEMVNAQGRDAADDILKIGELLNKIGEYFGYTQEMEFASGSAKWLANSVRGMMENEAEANFAGWLAVTESSRHKWVEDDIYRLNGRGAMYYTGGEDGVYMRISKDGKLDAGNYEGAFPHIGEAMFKSVVTRQFDSFSAAYKTAMEAGGKKFMVDMFSGSEPQPIAKAVGCDAAKPSVLDEIRESRSAPKPSKPKPEKTKATQNKKKSQTEL